MSEEDTYVTMWRCWGKGCDQLYELEEPCPNCKYKLLEYKGEIGERLE